MFFIRLFLISFTIVFITTSNAQQLYFPPLSANAVWQTQSPDSLGWCSDKIDSLYQFLGKENTRAFIVLKDGKIVLEKYFGTFTKDSNWYWASAGKTLTAFLIGKAQEEGLLKISDTSSKYLGQGWTSLTPTQEAKITIRSQLTMTSGLDDGVTDNHCTDKSCLIFKADEGKRWAYHNAPYTLLDKVINAATTLSMNNYTLSKIKLQTGMNGIWITSDYDNVFYSTPRSMARYGLLAQNNFIWSNDTLMFDTGYKNRMVNTSQQLNLSYGYLWWLNGKSSYMVPTSQIVIPGSYAPNAPKDMFAGIGKNGQLVSVSKSKRIVMIRMGDAPGSFGEVPTDFCDKIWLNLNKVMCNTQSLTKAENSLFQVQLYPNPTNDLAVLDIPKELTNCTFDLTNLLGKREVVSIQDNTISLSALPQGVYFLTIRQNHYQRIIKLIKN